MGRPCGRTGDCAAGLRCEYGACHAYCPTVSSKCTLAGTDICVGVNGNDDRPLPNLTICTIQCDPRAPSAVCGANSCEWLATYYSPFTKVSDCVLGGPNKQGDGCKSASNCLPGFACITRPGKPETDKECEAWCRMNQTPSDCPSGKTCKDEVFGDNSPVVGGIREGLCR